MIRPLWCLPRHHRGMCTGSCAGNDCERVEQVAGAAGESVQPCPQQHIPGGEPSEHLTQLCPVRLRAADDFPIHLDRPCGGQYRNLRLDALAIWRDSCRALDHALMMHIAFAQRKPNEISSSLRAKLVIFAQAGQADRAEVIAHAAGVHDTSTVTHRCSTRHTDALCATLQAIVWSARASSIEDATGHHACRGMHVGISNLRSFWAS